MPTVTALPPDAIVRLAKLLGMLGSEHVGERAAAGLKATDLLRIHGITWSDLIQQLNSPAPRNARANQTKAIWKTVAEQCIEIHDNGNDPLGPSMTAWEYGFVSDILERDRDLSDKQSAVLQRIASKMGVAFRG